MGIVEILQIVLGLIVSVITLWLAFILLRWMLKWLRRVVSFSIHIIITFTVLSAIFEFSYGAIFNKYLIYTASIQVANFTPILLLGLGIAYFFSCLAEKAAEKSRDLKPLITESVERLKEKTNYDAWFFSLYSICIIVIILMINGLILESIYLLPKAYLNNTLSYKSFTISFFPILGIVMLLLTRVKARGLVRFYGSWIISLNSLALTLISFYLYEPHILLSLDTQVFITASVDEPTAATLSAVFISFCYLISINISAFFAYGYDSGVAWLFEDENGNQRRDNRGQLVYQGSHWSQRLVRWLSNYLPGIKKHKERRMPEAILHWHSALGGAVGAYAGHSFFNHKKMFATERTTSSKSAIKFAPVYRRTFFIQTILLIGLCSLRAL